MQDNEINTFLSTLEAEKGGKIKWRTVTLFFGDSDGNVRVNGVFLYRVGDTFWYQDFKNEKTILGLKIGSFKNEPEYVKFEDSFNKEDVESVREVSLSKANKVCNGKINPEKAKTLGKLGKVFRDYVTEIKLKSGKALYFKLMKDSFTEELSKN